MHCLHASCVARIHIWFLIGKCQWVSDTDNIPFTPGTNVHTDIQTGKGIPQNLKGVVAADKDGDLDATVRTQEMEIYNRNLLLCSASTNDTGKFCFLPSKKKIATYMHKLCLVTACRDGL